MLFNSWAYAIFLPAVAVVFFSLALRYRWMCLLAASYVFYGYDKPGYVVLLLIATTATYYCALKIEKVSSGALRRVYLMAGIAVVLGLLFVFKYEGFFARTLDVIATGQWSLHEYLVTGVLLPVGISFYSFQSLGYLFDVHKRKVRAEKHFGLYALFVSFFPQLVAGPIERVERLLPQFSQEHRFDYARASSGLKRILWGLFKKLVVADRLGLYVDRVFANTEVGVVSGHDLFLATLFFAFQIYCDFSGYCDIAIGSARVMGFQLMENFDRPYLATSIREFWRKWHISLMGWFKDYVYIPMGGSRVSHFRRLLNVMVVFLLSGLWHGAAWSFVLWGFLHGSFYLCSEATRTWRSRLVEWCRLDRVPSLHRWFRISMVFSMVCFAWIFFRARTLGDALIALKKMARVGWISPASMFDHVPLGVTTSMLVMLAFISWIGGPGDRTGTFDRRPLWIRWSVYYALICSIIFFSPRGVHAFIYFQF